MTSSPDSRVIVETGDVFLTLRNPCADFAVWESEAEETDGTERADEESEEVDDTSVNETSSDTLVTDSDQHTQDEASPCVVVYHVSSQHLITASPKFRSELTSWSESRKGEDGFYHIHTDDWDPQALEILLNVLHLRFRQVPRSLVLELLAEVAMLVDYYRCWEAFDLIADVWITNIRKTDPVPKAYGRDLMLWMIISWVFKLQDEFSLCTFRALRQSDEPTLRDLELGIPPAILQKLEHRRTSLIQEAIAVCQGWFDKLCGTYLCIHDKDVSFECGSMLLGALTKQMNNMGILTPKPVAPFSGFSLEELQNSIKSIRTPKWSPTQYSKHPCSLDSVIHEVSDVINRARGLELKDFVDRAETATDAAPRQG